MENKSQQSAGTVLTENVAAAAAAAYRMPVPYYQLLQQQQMEAFWALQLKEIKEMNDFKNNKFPLARINR
ncbi:hypothetical protein P3S68_006893 [Capsicum galapagoense]